MVDKTVTRMRGFWSHAGPRAASLWLLVYLLTCLTGQGFNTEYLNYGWQLIPWDILSTDPLRSVWYLHIQPPLWNLLLGSLAKLSPFTDALTLQILMAFFGVLVAGLAAVLARRLGISRRWAVTVALVASLNPEVFKGAFEPTYELATAALLLLVLIAVADLSHKENVPRSLMIVAVATTVTAMTRSLYHPAWALLIVLFSLWLMRGRIVWRTVAIVLAIPVMVMGGWMAKNEILFGHATMSSWFGMNLQRAYIPVLPKADLDEMYQAGRISDIAMIGPFGNYELYRDVMPECTAKHSFRGTSEPTRMTDPDSPNFNYECFLPIFDRAGKDALTVAREHPDIWLKGRLWSLRISAAVAISPSQSDSVVIRGLDTVFSVARVDYRGILSTVGWGTPIYGSLTAPVDFGLLLIPGYFFIGFVGLRILIARLRRRFLPAEAGVYLVGSFTVCFTIIVGVIFELGEQSRFRTMVDPIATVMLGALIVSYVSEKMSTPRAQSQADSVGQ